MASSDSLLDLSKSVSSILSTNFPPLDLKPHPNTQSIKLKINEDPDFKIEFLGRKKGPCEQVVEEGRSGTADVEVSGGRRSETNANGWWLFGESRD